MDPSAFRADKAGALESRASTGPARHRRRGARDGLATPALLLAPAGLIYGLFTIIPVLATVGISFTNSAGFNTDAEFVGLRNYVRATEDPIIWQSIGRTFLWLVYHVVLAGGGGLVLAVAISGLRRTRVFFRAAFFLPHLVSTAVVGVIWANVYDPYYGLISGVLGRLGLSSWNQPWLSDPALVLLSVSVASAWQAFGLYMLLFLAGLQNIDPTLYEAAEIDGANAWQKLWYVTLPGLRDVMTFVVSLAMIAGLNGFATVYVMTNGGPYHASELITTYIYRLAFQAQDHGLAAVLCIVMSIISIAITIAFNRWRRERSE